MKKIVREEKEDAVKELYEALLLLKTIDEINRFFNDLCTPKEIKSLAERWRVCKLLDQGSLSYRDINNLTGASLVTIGRVARFLKTEPHHGYTLMLERLSKNKSKK